jgi:hypothetical protein
MLLPILITLVKIISGVGLTWLGFELTFRVPQNAQEKKRARILIALFAGTFICLELWTTVRNEEESRELPQRIAEYIKNTAPPPGVQLGPPSSAQVMRPNPPEGLIGATNGDWGAVASGLSTQINNLVYSEGQLPSRKPGEGDLDFVVRSNAWYSNILSQYKKQFEPQVITLVGVLSENGAVQKQLADLARDPINVIGIRTVATELDNAGRKYRELQKQR